MERIFRKIKTKWFNNNKMKKYKILFPCCPLYPNDVDPDYKTEYNLADIMGLGILYYDYEKLVQDTKVKIPQFFRKKTFETSNVIMRGWMLKVEDYAFLYHYLAERGHTLINTPEQYKRCHWLPESYPHLKAFSPATLYSPGTDIEVLWCLVQRMGGKDFILKDYVKSEKGIPHLFKIDGNIKKSEFAKIINEFVEERGKLFNEGIVLREFIDLKKYDGEVNEWRCFVLNGEVADLSQNSNIKGLIAAPAKELVKFTCDTLRGLSNFFTVDFAEKENGSWIVIETGDGQVSGLTPKQNPVGLLNKFEYE